MDLSVSLHTDDDGFLRRECPTCERQFKWFVGSTINRPDDVAEPDEYFCPYCAEPAATDQWWTHDQLDQVQAEIAPDLMQIVHDELTKTAKSIRSDFIKMSVTTEPVPPPTPLLEPNDMVMVEAPCHPWEPVKISEDWTATIYCLVCGAEFTLD